MYSIVLDVHLKIVLNSSETKTGLVVYSISVHNVNIESTTIHFNTMEGELIYYYNMFIILYSFY